jgi:hypothetical protein
LSGSGVAGAVGGVAGGGGGFASPCSSVFADEAAAVSEVSAGLSVVFEASSVFGFLSSPEAFGVAAVLAFPFDFVDEGAADNTLQVNQTGSKAKASTTLM